MIKIGICSGFLLFFSFLGKTQEYWGIGPFMNLQGYFKAVNNGVIRQLEYLPVKSYQVGDNLLGYEDNKGDLKVFFGDKIKTIAGIANRYTISDNILVFNTGPITSLWMNGSGLTLTNFGRRYIVTDSLCVFEDTQQNMVKVWYDNAIHDLYGVIGEIYLPTHVGDNIVAFKAGGGTHFIFHRGQMYELDTYREAVKFSCGRDIVAFNDPIHMSFAIFEEGHFLDLDPLHAKSFKAGISCVTYINQNNELHYYKGGKLRTLSNYAPDYWDAIDNMVLWGEGDLFQVFDSENIMTAAYYRPERWVMKNNVIAFQNQMQGVDIVVGGQVINLTNEPVVDFFISGTTVMVELPNQTYLAYSGGRIIRS
jgi:hypothetical protein